MKGQKKDPAQAIREDSASTGSGIENLSKRVNRYSQGREKTLSIKEYIELNIKQYKGKQKIKLAKAAKRLADCGNFLDFHHYYTIDEVKLAQANFCKQHLLCQLCAMRRGAKQARTAAEKVAYIQRVAPELKVAMLTLTVKDGGDLAERFQHLLNGKKKIIYTMQNSKKRKKAVSEFAKIEGILGAVEITRGKGSKLWHPHIHAVIVYKGDFELLRERGRLVTRWDNRRQVRVPQLQLCAEWERMTGDSFILDVSPITAKTEDELISHVCEVYKYALKFSSMSARDVIEAYLLLSGRQMVFSSGLLRGLDVEPEDLLDEIPYSYDDLPYVRYLYRFISGAGYSLEKFEKFAAGAVTSDPVKY